MLRWGAGFCTWVPDLHLGATDRKYPISESIAAMLPKDAAKRASVLADPVAAKAIMRITDIAVYRASIRGHSAATKYISVRVIIDGAETLLTKVPEDALAGWLTDRGCRLPPPPQRKGDSEQSNWCQEKVLHILIGYMEFKDTVKHATERLERSILEHVAA